MDKCSDNLVSEIRACIAELLDISTELVVPGVSLLDLGAQSFDFVQLVFKLERAYGIEISRSYTIPDMHTLDTYVQIVAAARGTQPTPRRVRRSTNLGRP